VLGLIVLAAATIMLHLGTTIAMLIVARILQGISAAVVWVVGLALLADTISKDEVGHAMGYVFLGMSLGILLGPVLGGIVFEKLGYDAVYIMVYCLIAIDIALRLVAIEKKVARQWLNDSSSQAPEQVELQEITPVNGVVRTNMEEPNGTTTQSSRAPSFIFLLRSKSFLASLWGAVVLAVLMTAFDAVLPLYVKETFDWTSLGAGN
jgi:MFS family permease